ncbi:MAG: SDR family oxidoreductase [Bacillota bacterium]
MRKAVVITGAGSGLGQALADKFSKKGAKIHLIGRTLDKLKSTAKKLENPFEIHQLDIRKREEVEKVFSKINGVDILINNAGLGRFGKAEKLKKKDIDQMIDTNLKGTIFCTQAVLKKMKKVNNGHIVNIISTAGKKGKATESVYCASKFGIRGFTDSLEKELKESKIDVSAFYMGGMNTPFWDGILAEEKKEKFMNPSDVAEIIFANLKNRNRLNIKEVLINSKK